MKFFLATLAFAFSWPVMSVASDLDPLATCLKRFPGDSDAMSLKRGTCFSEKTVELVSKAEPFLLLASVNCLGGESRLAVASDVFNEAANSNMEVFAKFQKEGSRLAHAVLIEGEPRTYGPFCTEVREMYGPKGHDFSGLYSKDGKHIYP